MSSVDGNTITSSPDATTSHSTRQSINNCQVAGYEKGRPEGVVFLLYVKKFTTLAREKRKKSTPAEQKMWREVLSRSQFSGYKFSRQKPIQHFIVDFYCAQLGWVIEIDGDSHAEQISYDEKRTSLLQQYGLTVKGYNNHDVLNNIAGVYDDLMMRVS